MLQFTIKTDFVAVANGDDSDAGVAHVRNGAQLENGVFEPAYVQDQKLRRALFRQTCGSGCQIARRILSILDIERGQALADDGFRFLITDENPGSRRCRPLGIARTRKCLCLTHLSAFPCEATFNAFFLMQS